MTDPLALLPPRRGVILAALIAIAGAVPLVSPLAAAAAADRSDERASYVLFNSGSGDMSMSGSTDDIARAAQLRVGKEALLYVREGGAAYVIRDAATIRQAQAIFEPQKALGAKQSALGSRQAALGAEQAELGRRQAAAPAERAGDLGHAQAALGRQQGALGAQQAALGREQGRLAREARAKIRALLASAIQKGVAQRMD